MKNALSKEPVSYISSLEELAGFTNYSFMDSLNTDSEATENGVDHDPRQVFSGHYVPVKPTPIENPEYVVHSKQFFEELGFADSLAESADFMRAFSGDLSQVPESMRKVGWATGYALSIFGTEYIQQCPFRTGNGYGDGRAVSVFEGVINGQRWEMQLKGGGRTPYCRGADGRAVLRSSVREFLAQEHMHGLGVPTSRSLSLYVSKTEQVQRPWYSEGSHSFEPDRVVSEAVAITTRVAPSFIRVGQVELFGRRARPDTEYSTHPDATQELEMLVLHLIDREYADEIDQNLGLSEKVLMLATAFRGRLCSLVANWIRVGYCQGNFNSDNTAVGGFTLDYGPFGFMERFDPAYQPWTGGGEHFSFFNQTVAAERNFSSFCTALAPLLMDDTDAQPSMMPDALEALETIRKGFAGVMREQMEVMLASKMGLDAFDGLLFSELANLMMQTSVDYTIFFRELSSLPDTIEPLRKSFYKDVDAAGDTAWSEWLEKWRALIKSSSRSEDEISAQMKRVNPKYILREWLLAPAYQHAARGDYELLRELQDVMTQPYDEQSAETEAKYYRLKPAEFSELGGVSHMSCSS